MVPAGASSVEVPRDRFVNGGLTPGKLGVSFAIVPTGGNGDPCLPVYKLCAGPGSWVGTKL